MRDHLLTSGKIPFDSDKSLLSYDLSRETH